MKNEKIKNQKSKIKMKNKKIKQELKLLLFNNRNLITAE